MVIQAAFDKSKKGAGKGGGMPWSKGKGGWGGKGKMMMVPVEMLMGKGGWGYSGTFKVDRSGGELGEHTGTIKSFGYSKNYGFIECAELAEHGDVFLHGDEKKGYQQGQIVKFDAVLNKDGKPVAIKLRSGLKPSAGGPSAQGGKSPAVSGGKGSYSADRSGGELGEHIGTIKSFGFWNNYGFIECPALAGHGDVFLHGNEIRGYQQGQKVKFDAVLNKNGKPVATNLRSGLK